MDEQSAAALESNFVYFSGKTEQTFFGLGGSAHHVIGEEKTRWGHPLSIR
ncbi:MAG: hypothetical protein WBP64_01550 [Nitrososphaeraceae archaeon]